MSHEEDMAWQVARTFGRRVSSGLGENLLSAVVIGSLADRCFLPGVSEIDTALILRDDPDEDTDSTVEAAKQDARGSVSESPAVHCAYLTRNDLHPPYPPERETAPIVLRVHDHGILIAGEELRAEIERPTSADFSAYVRHTDMLVRASLPPEQSDHDFTYRELYGLAATACRHYIFLRENLLIWRKTEVLLAFLMGYDDHPRAEVVRRFIEQSPAPREVDAAFVRDVSTLWRELHAEITA